MRNKIWQRLLGTRLTAVAAVASVLIANAEARTLLNVSYDPTRELYKDINRAFVEEWKARTGETIRILMSHGGSGRQARAVIDGLDADVVSLALAADVDAIVRATEKIPPEWQKRLRPILPRSYFWYAREIPRISRIGMISRDPTFR